MIDNLATVPGRENIEHLLDHPRVTFIEGSITDLDLLMEAFPGADGILAGTPGAPVGEGSPRLERGERDRHRQCARPSKHTTRSMPLSHPFSFYLVG
ncbi:hypothetical protein [Methanoculleus formosensis]|uniref:hypothetical protein n=1 Tax=Methanoculleus formosensis TaxID=2590886 RepID=UPI0036F35732